MLVKDFNFRIVIKDKKANCVCKTLYGNEARIKLYELVNNTNASIELASGFKDINGVDIFIGDIVEIKATKSLKRYEVANKEGLIYLINGSDSFPLYMANAIHELEIIGNIHENKEFLQDLESKRADFLSSDPLVYDTALVEQNDPSSHEIGSWRVEPPLVIVEQSKTSLVVRVSDSLA